ncbi:hypothetical protein [Demequina sp.]|uniref:hypothetical protein n=1 Tax=Demequina sp. TaxID=2050685 RepID=UPI0025B9949B|nr:hypothetical protein [Demequina sp.]
MVKAPRQRPSELIREAQLTRSKVMVVEGHDDKRFFEEWLQTVLPTGRVTIVPVDFVDVDPQEVIRRGLNEGCRSSVIVLAHLAQAHVAEILCVADRDTGAHCDEFAVASLRFTDFPALESYCLDQVTLNTVRNVALREKIPPVADFMPGLEFALRELFAVRCMHPNLPKPNYAKGISKQGTGLMGFDVAAAMEPGMSALCASYERTTSTDSRSYAYGHDISELLFAQYKNQLKNGCGIARPEALEAVFRIAMLATKSFEEEPFFKSIIEWYKTPREGAR